ncbi:MAG: metal ABC transporter ATP-binding protein [Rhodospirillales bacterium]|nr:metal ABC transporter ATP-binding protein [Rhodospirillales bacterium]MBO6788693.1 metal ABC transporter ATP-binding protein [Rhodospirillales bacterium]
MDTGRQTSLAKNRSLIAARGVGVRHGTRWLIENVDLTVHAGEIVTLIGPNGSGKSTTVRALLGLIDHHAGIIDRAPGLRVGYVPQKISVDWTMPLTVRRFMTLTDRHPPAAIDAALDEVGLGDFSDRNVQVLSGGEFQRLLLARAIIAEPDLLILDEPVQGVDAAGEIALYELIADLSHRHDCGVLLISHDLHIVMAATDTVICLNGHVCCSGTPKTVTESPEYRSLFGARAAEALAIYHHHHDHSHLPDGTVVRTGGADDHSACTHPEHRHDHR